MEVFYVINDGVYDKVKRMLVRVVATPKVRPFLGVSGSDAKKLLEDFMSVKVLEIPTRKDQTDRTKPLKVP